MGVVSDFNSIEREFTEAEASKSWKILFTNLRADSDKLNEDIESQAAKNPINKPRNRYRDVLPYDHTRVAICGIGNNDYINASYVQLKNCNLKRRYILTQGPLTSTIPHFWRMVWTEGSSCIVMLNKLIEKDVVKCAQYFPTIVGDTISHEYDDLNLYVSLLDKIEKSDYVLRVLTLEDKLTGEVRRVVQFHYLSWPDFGVPLTPESFLQFLADVRSSCGLDDVDRPCVVHCSAGIGRSGTFVLIDLALLRMNEYEGNVNLREMLLELRKCRMGLVQAPEQLRFAYLAIINGARSMLKSTDSEKIHSDLHDSVPEQDLGDRSGSEEDREGDTHSDFSDNSDIIRNNCAIDNAATAARKRRGIPLSEELEDSTDKSQSNHSNDQSVKPNVYSEPRSADSDIEDRKQIREARRIRIQQKVEEIRSNLRRQDLERNRWINVLRPARYTHGLSPCLLGVTVLAGALSLMLGLAIYKFAA